ncbi:hypothetical protein ACFX5K_06070 [Rickettsiales bacterium LUAb2]
MNADPKVFYQLLRDNDVVQRGINTNITEIDITKIFKILKLNLHTEEKKANIIFLLEQLGFTQAPLTLTSSMGIKSVGIYQINKSIEILDRENNYHKQTNNITTSSGLSQTRELHHREEPPAKRPRIEQTPVKQGASSSVTVDDNTNLAKRLFLELEKQGKIIEVHNKVKNQINLSVTYDDAYNNIPLPYKRHIKAHLELLGFKLDTSNLNIFTIPYNIDLDKYIKYYLTFVCTKGMNETINIKRISQLTEIYKPTTIIDNARDIQSKLSLKRFKSYCNEILNLKKTSGYVYKDTID